jgi:hypothetical protein
VQLTKLGNVQWTDDDVKKIKAQIAGKTVFEDYTFKPKTDAVTSATMSSGLIYEAFNDAKAGFGNFKAYKFRYEHWKQLCFNNLCSIKKIAAAYRQLHTGAALDDALLSKILSENKQLACPLDGTLMPIDNSLLCSIHGVHTAVCEQ